MSPLFAPLMAFDREMVCKWWLGFRSEGSNNSPQAKGGCRHGRALLNRRPLPARRPESPGDWPARQGHQASVMKPRTFLVAHVVSDLARSARFRRGGPGLKTEGIMGVEFERGAVAFFDPQPGLRLALWQRSNLARDVGAPPCRPSGAGLCLAHNVPVPAVIVQGFLGGQVVTTRSLSLADDGRSPHARSFRHHCLAVCAHDGDRHRLELPQHGT